jgi:hypothetical protein
MEESASAAMSESSSASASAVNESISLESDRDQVSFLASSPRCNILFPLLLRTTFQSSHFLLIDEFASFSPRVYSEISARRDFTCAFDCFCACVDSSHASHADCCEPFISIFPHVDQLTSNELALFRSILADLESPGDGAVLSASDVARVFEAFVAAWKSRTPSSTASGESSLAGLDQFLQSPQRWVQNAPMDISECAQLSSAIHNAMISRLLSYTSCPRFACQISKKVPVVPPSSVALCSASKLLCNHSATLHSSKLWQPSTPNLSGLGRPFSNNSIRVRRSHEDHFHCCLPCLLSIYVLSIVLLEFLVSPQFFRRRPRNLRYCP